MHNFEPSHFLWCSFAPCMQILHNAAQKEGLCPSHMQRSATNIALINSSTVTLPSFTVLMENEIISQLAIGFRKGSVWLHCGFLYGPTSSSSRTADSVESDLEGIIIVMK